MGDQSACQFSDEGVTAVVEEEAGVGSALDSGDPDLGGSAEPSTCSAGSCGASSDSSLSNEGEWSLETIGEAGDAVGELLRGGLDMVNEERERKLGISRI